MTTPTRGVYDFLRSVGEDMFSIMGDEINAMSNEYIRTEKRKKVDFDEMCLAMGIIYYKMMRTREIWFGNPNKVDGFRGLDGVIASEKSRRQNNDE